MEGRLPDTPRHVGYATIKKHESQIGSRNPIFIKREVY